jgi:tetratricopeptide (TPR) repeat protein
VLKDCGNIKFKEGKSEEAEKLYRDSILKLEEVRHLVTAAHKDEAVSLETSILLNLSNIKAQNKEFDSLLDIAKEIVLLNPSSGKGFYRYAQALFHLGKAEAALEKVRTAKKLSSFSESRGL